MNTMQCNLPFCIYLRAVEVYTKCVANATMLEFFKVRGVCIVENFIVVQVNSWLHTFVQHLLQYNL